MSAQELSLKIQIPAEPIHVGDYPKFQIIVSNNGNKPMTLVEPGDGSESGWRTPVIGWSVLSADKPDAKHPKEPPLFHGGRCKMINPLKLNEIFTLKPGESRQLGGSVDSPSFVRPGKFRVRFYYHNIPSLSVSGVPLGKHEDGVMDKIKQSYPCCLVSNEIIVDVSPKKE